MKEAFVSDISAPWQTLVQLCQELNFGYIEGLEFRGGKPTGELLTVKTFRPGKDNGPSPVAGRADLPLKPQWHDVFALALSQPVVRVRRFEVIHGNPLKLHVEGSGGTLDG
jgi:hypothetical protein